jgi:nitrite reductase/ring-hydroxylating ferredoxin subunit
MPTAWTAAFSIDALPRGRARVLRASGRQIAVFHCDDGALRAIDNLCPHEGYPLVAGTVRGCVLTCAWHDFRFSLETGRCLAGEEDVRTWPVRVVDGVVEVDLGIADREAERARLRASLEAGMHEPDEMGRAVRDAVRLLTAGESPEDIAARAVAFDARHARYGSTHALPVAADILRWLPRYPGVAAALPLAQILELAAAEAHRRPPRRLPDAEAPPHDPDLALQTFRARAEAEDFRGAEALLLGALARGAPRDLIERWMLSLSTDHFLGFGHGLIFTVKTFALLDAVGWRWAPAILPGALVSVLVSVREDALPLHAALRRRLDVLEPELERLFTSARDDATLDADAFAQPILDGGKEAALDAVVQALRDRVAPSRIAAELVLCAAERWLRFDPAIDADPTLAEGWLDVTHVFTFASAVRVGLARLQAPDALRWLLHAAAFIARTRGLDAPAHARSVPDPTDCASTEEIVAAIRAKAPRAAVALGRGWLRASGGKLCALRHALEDLPLADVTVKPIVTAHVIKGVTAAFDEADASLPDPRFERPIQALLRWLASPLDERRLARQTHEALELVAHVRPPRRRVR